MKKNTLSLLFACFTLSALSQGFKPGYMITLAGDSTYGLVDASIAKLAQDVCVFKASPDSPTLRYSPEDIKGYGFIGDKFYEAWPTSVLSGVDELRFFEVIVKGTVSLFKLDNVFYVSKHNEALQKLIITTSFVNVNNETRSKQSTEHVAILTNMTFDCPLVRGKLQRVMLNERYLASLITAYNRCKGDPQVHYKANLSRTRLRIGMAGGMTRSTLEVKSDHANFVDISKSFKPSTFPAYGLLLELSSPRFNKRISFLGEVYLSRSKYEIHTVTEAAFSSRTNDVEVNVTNIKIPIGVRYTIPWRSVAPFLCAGGAATRHVRSDSWRIIQATQSNGSVQRDEMEAFLIKPTAYGAWAGAGFSKIIGGKIQAGLEVRYEINSGITSDFDYSAIGLSSSISSFQVLFRITSH